MADVAKVVELLRGCAGVIEHHAARLTELDAAIGDADHGSNMAKGFRAVGEKVLAQPPADLAALLKAVGMALISSVGGSAGPLYGTAFLRAAQVVAGRSSLDAAAFAEVLAAALEGIRSRGKAEVGEKTMVDVLSPAVEGYVSGGLVGMVKAARAGLDRTAGLRATKGRASYLGERSVGHLDPGSASCYLILLSIAHGLGAEVGNPVDEVI